MCQTLECAFNPLEKSSMDYIKYIILNQDLAVTGIKKGENPWLKKLWFWPKSCSLCNWILAEEAL